MGSFSGSVIGILLAQQLVVSPGLVLPRRDRVLGAGCWVLDSGWYGKFYIYHAALSHGTGGDGPGWNGAGRNEGRVYVLRTV